MLGTLGSLLILAAFAAALLCGVAYVLAVRDDGQAALWKRLGRGSWWTSLVASTGAFAILLVLFGTSQYRYAYVYSNSSNDLPMYFKLSASWAGQEGSFLLWVVFVVLTGAALLWWFPRGRGRGAELRRAFEAPVMAVMALGLAFMLSMILGIRLGPLTVGASPFITLAERFPDAPFLQAGGVPVDGNGLNDLLQNYWMTIHPPTLFAGFTLAMVPFAFAVAALWTRRYTEWVRPALPWALAAMLVLALGIMMGGYWAYVTLSFGGWWAWDPVENSSLVPWLLGVAAIHAMLVQKKSSAGHKSALLLSIATFIFVVYSTFLTRSGILGDISVHSFVDLGLYNQLLLWIGTMAVLGFGLFALRYRELPRPARPMASLSREGLIFAGALVLALIGAVVIIGTSAPILGRLFRDNPAAVATSFYDAWTLPLAVVMALLAGLGQLFWWRKMEVAELNRVLLKPLGLSVVATAVVLAVTPFTAMTVRPQAPQLAQASPEMIGAGLGVTLGGLWDVYGHSLLLLLLLFAAFFALFGNGAVLWRIGRGNPKMVGGSVAHVGMALMLLGIVATSVFYRPLTDGRGANISGDRNNFILQLGETKDVEGFRFTYVGHTLNERGRPVYELDVVDRRGHAFRARAEVYQSRTGQWIQHPHVERGLFEDLYMAIYPSAMMQPVEGIEGEGGELLLRRGELAPLNDGAFTVRFVAYDLSPDPERLQELLRELGRDRLEIAVGARLEVTNRVSGETRRLAPIYAVLPDGSQHFIQNRIADWGLTFTFAGMRVEDDAVRILVEGARTTPEDWLVVQAIRKPFINLLWLGTILLGLGFGIAAYRRTLDTRR